MCTTSVQNMDFPLVNGAIATRGLSLEITETTDGLIKDHVYYTMLEICWLAFERCRKKKLVGQNGNNPDLNVYSHSQLQPFYIAARMRQFISQLVARQFTFSVAEKRRFDTKNFTFISESVFNRRCVNMEWHLVRGESGDEATAN